MPVCIQLMDEKLQKVLADRGHGSRREMERWISAGRVLVNGETAHLGQRVAIDDKIELDGKSLRPTKADRSRVLLLNKPVGLVCTRKDPEGRKTVFDTLPKLSHGRWITIGRLDIQTSGLLLVTNDGDLAHKMMHPSTGLDREYAVRVDGKLSDSDLSRLKKGVYIDGELLGFSDLRYYNGSDNNHWYHAVLMEGKNREVRRLFGDCDIRVSRLKRVRYGPVLLPSVVKRGNSIELGVEDLAGLYKILGLPFTRPQGKPRRESKREKSVLIPYPSLKAVTGSGSEETRSGDTRDTEALRKPGKSKR